MRQQSKLETDFCFRDRLTAFAGTSRDLFLSHGSDRIASYQELGRHAVLARSVVRHVHTATSAGSLRKGIYLLLFWPHPTDAGPVRRNLTSQRRPRELNHAWPDESVTCILRILLYRSPTNSICELWHLLPQPLCPRRRNRRGVRHDSMRSTALTHVAFRMMSLIDDTS